MIRSLISGFSDNRPTSWTIISTQMSSSSVLAYNGSIFTCQTSDMNIYTSTDGITWVLKAEYVNFYANSATYSTPSTLIMVGYAIDTFRAAIATSSDSVTWTLRTTTGFGSTAYIKDICWSGTYLVAVSDEGHIATSSSSGSTWTQRAKSANPFEAVAFGAGTYIAVGYRELWTSTNGTNWTDRSSTFLNLFASSAAYGNGLFVVVDNIGKIYTSLDGITWTQRTSPFGNTKINKVTYGGNKFVAVGVGGKIATSTDGITWVLSESPVTNNLLAVAYGNNKFVAMGGYKSVITSPTGL